MYPHHLIDCFSVYTVCVSLYIIESISYIIQCMTLDASHFIYLLYHIIPVGGGGGGGGYVCRLLLYY